MENKNFIDNIIDFFCKINIIKPLWNLYYKYREIWLYLFFGFATTIVNIISYELLINIFKVNYLICNFIAWIITIIFAYITNKKYVFDSNNDSLKSEFKKIALFTYARVFSLIIEMIIMYIGVSIFTINDTIVKIITSIIIIIMNYFFSKFLIFKKKN